MRQTALVGASGFIGTRLIDLLGKENCYNIDKNPSEKYNDITTIQDIREKNLEHVLSNFTETVILLAAEHRDDVSPILSLIHISEPTRRTPISYAVFCLKKK